MKKNWWKLLSLIVLLAATLTMFITYFWTYNTSGQTIITTNAYGERLVEHIMLGLAIIGSVVMVIQMTIKLADEHRTQGNLTPTGTTVEIRVGEESWIVGFAYEEDDQSGIIVNPNHEIILECCGRPESECDCEQK